MPTISLQKLRRFTDLHVHLSNNSTSKSIFPVNSLPHQYYYFKFPQDHSTGPFEFNSCSWVITSFPSIQDYVLILKEYQIMFLILKELWQDCLSKKLSILWLFDIPRRFPIIQVPYLKTKTFTQIYVFEFNPPMHPVYCNSSHLFKWNTFIFDLQIN